MRIPRRSRATASAVAAPARRRAPARSSTSAAADRPQPARPARGTSRIEALLEAVPGAGNLLGNLLCGITGILDPQAATPATPSLLTQVLNALLALVPPHRVDCTRPRPASRPRGGPLPSPVVRIFSGIQPTGRKHLGNYIGAILQYVAGQERGDPAIYCIVDLHAITVDYDPAELRERTLRHGRAADRRRARPRALHPLPPGRRHEHTELSWLLSSVTRSASSTACTSSATSRSRSASSSSAGLLFYPVLMAADVLAYRATRCRWARTSASTSS